MLSRYTAPFNFDFDVTLIRWNFDFVCSEIDFTTSSHTFAMEVTRIANVFCTRLARESFNDTSYFSHLLFENIDRCVIDVFEFQLENVAT